MGDLPAALRSAEVCVVGAGPAGITAALALGSAGRAVVLLESGQLRASHPIQELNDGDHEGAPYDGLVRTRQRQVGGTANIWNVPVDGELGAKYVPLSPRDLADWPIDWAELEPHYREAQTVCGLGPFEYGAEYWAREVGPPFRLDGTGLTSGVYQFGGARQFTHVLVERLTRTDTVTLVPSTTVVALDVDRWARRVRGIRAVAGNGDRLDVPARAVVLACGAVENARLLLLAGLSGEDRSPWLGRGFMEHARDFSLVLVPDAPEVFADAAFYDLHTTAGGLRVGGRLAITDAALESFQLPNASLTLVPRVRRRGPRGLIEEMRRLIGRGDGGLWPGRYGWSQVPSPATAFDAFGLVLNLEQRPHPWNRVELSARRDRFGNPLPKLLLQWTDEEQAGLERLRDRLEEWFRAARLGRLRILRGRRPDLNAHHHAGTTRMAGDPSAGVVDPQSRVFGLENLYVAGASVFPTAGFANPTLTIVATALRLARHIDVSLG
jgi:choline dehydrogenase-like flavoprotein